MKLIICVSTFLTRIFAGHFYVSTERDEADDVLSFSPGECQQPGFPAKDSRLESDSEGVDLDSHKLGRKEVAQLMNEDQKSDSKDGKDKIQGIQLLTLLRVSRSASRITSRLSAGTGSCSSMARATRS